ncbi:MAG: hypothetical protein DYG89_00680 [Caldilinea sp. CFX5]|nr:hypothetical protein [Caldilinea sp. CFX5]
MNAIAEFDVTTDILARLESQQTPVRIQGQRHAYYVLTVDQILALMQLLKAGRMVVASIAAAIKSRLVQFS